MKKYTLYIVVICCCFFGKAKGQAWQYHPIPYSNALWKYYYTDCCCAGGSVPFYYYFQYKTNGDTVLNGHSYAKLYYEELVPGQCSQPGSYSFYYSGCIRNDTANKRVYVVDAGTTERLALDFNLNVGDTITQCYHDTIKNIDSVSIGGSYRKRLYTKGGNQMIEGIGGVIEIFYNAYCGQHMSPYVGFICFTEDSITYLLPNASGTCPTISNSVGIENYQLSTLNCQLTPNPTTGIFTIHTEGTNIKEIKVFTVLGEEVGITNYKLPISPSTPLRVTDEVTVDMSGFAKGIYFVRITDEKKTVVNKKIVVQ